MPVVVLSCCCSWESAWVSVCVLSLPGRAREEAALSSCASWELMVMAVLVFQKQKS